jgi:hypothetical protein
MSFTSWFTPIITPILKDAVTAAVNEAKKEIVKDIESKIDAEIEPLEQALSRIEDSFGGLETNIVDKVGALEGTVLSNFSTINNLLTNLSGQIINGIMAKLPHFPGF